MGLASAGRFNQNVLMPPRRPIILGFHIIFTGYGHWLPNDIRGSGSSEVNSRPLRELGPIHLGRKPVQPPRGELRKFLGEAEERLQFPVLWFDEPMRQSLAAGFAEAIRKEGYTCYAAAVLRNHFHCLIRRHCDDADAICDRLSEHSRQALLAANPQLGNHPIWGRDDHKIFKDSVGAMRATVGYVNKNPQREGLPPQSWPFVTPYDGWPGKRS
jgi:REP element-mobilizing transposase RayT